MTWTDTCETAEDVRLRAAKVRAWRQRGYARIPVMPAAPQPCRPPLTVAGEPVKSNQIMIMEFVRQIQRMNTEWTPWRDRPPIWVIVRKTAAAFRVKPDDILSARRTQSVILPRHVAMYLSRELTLASFPEIGRRIGNRDHTTALHGWRKIKHRIVRDEGLRAVVDELKFRLGGAQS